MQVVCVEHKIVTTDRGEERLTKKRYVFVTVGSTDFDALVQACDSLTPPLQGIMQIGHGRYIPVNMPYFRFAPSLAPYYERASLVIAHGGLATVTEVLERGLALVGVSNPDRYDKHQEELLTALTEEGYLVWCRQLGDLKQAIETAQTTPLRRYQLPDGEIHLIINEFLKSFEK
jgi:UDP-N-acetylglucosamine transferase subunit ALG13